MPAQVAKLLVIPFVCMIECWWLKRVFTRPVILSVVLVVAGVAVVYDTFPLIPRPPSSLLQEACYLLPSLHCAAAAFPCCRLSFQPCHHCAG